MELEYAGRRYPVPQGELVLGSDPASGVVLEGAGARHAVVRVLGPTMATVRVVNPDLIVTVNTVRVGQEPTPLLHGDVIRIGTHQLTVLNPAHPVGTARTPPEGAKERLHDTLFGVPRHSMTAPAPASPPEPQPKRTGIVWVIVAAAVSLGVLAFLLLR
jgi:hypothetical protein